MHYLLHLETSTKACSVAISADGKCVSLKEILTEEFAHSENLTLFIQDALKDAGIALKDLHAVSVASGPGSYTGLRIGVSTAKGLCYALNIPLISVDSLISLAYLAKIKHPSMNLCPLIDARRMEVFNAVYTSDLIPLKPISADIIDEQTYQTFEPFVYFGDGAAKLTAVWEGRNVIADLEIHASASGQISLAFQKFENEEFEDVAYFEPFYLKDFVSIQKSKP